MRTWGFLTNHAHVLIQIARQPKTTVREIALAAGITERATIAVLHDLRRSSIVSSRREGRRNVYSVHVRALTKHRPWGAAPMEIPDSLIQATVRGLIEVTGEPPV